MPRFTSLHATDSASRHTSVIFTTPRAKTITFFSTLTNSSLSLQPQPQLQHHNSTHSDDEENIPKRPRAKITKKLKALPKSSLSQREVPNERGQSITPDMSKTTAIQLSKITILSQKKGHP
jgi:hypothetical protein